MACKISIPLSSGYFMPALGYGTWQAREGELETALEHALEAGYRHIDTAWVYDNEDTIGEILKKWIDSGKVKREDLFITTKLPFYGNRPRDVEKYLTESLKKLGLDYVDMYLMHAPFGYFKQGDTMADWVLDASTDHAAIWKEMERQVEQGRTKSIGVSNFNVRQVENLLKTAKIPPATNQVELHAYLQQPELVKFHKEHNVAVTAYSPLGTRGTQALFEKRGIQKFVPNIMENPVVVEVSSKYGKTPAQILLRHLVQKNLIVIPKSVNPKRLAENIDIFDFEIKSDDMEKLDALDCNGRVLHFREVFQGVENHPEYPF